MEPDVYGVLNVTFNIRIATRSAKGVYRTENQDRTCQDLKRRFFILADGIGGHQSGEVAASFVIENLAVKLADHIDRHDPPSLKEEDLLHMIQDVDQKLQEKARSDESLHGMGCTLCLIVLLDDHAICSHVGDSRIYSFSHYHLSPLTIDDSLGGESKHILTRAMGSEEKIYPTIQNFPLRHGDCFLMSSDGLTDMVSDEKMESILQSELPIEKIAANLIETAKQAGGTDDITVMLIQVNKDDHKP